MKTFYIISLLIIEITMINAFYFKQFNNLRSLTEKLYKYDKSTICNNPTLISSIPILTEIPSTNTEIPFTNTEIPSVNVVPLHDISLISNNNSSNIIKKNCTENNNKVPIWGACSNSLLCDDNSICVKQSIHYSQCMPLKLNIMDLCGQNDNNQINWIYDNCNNSNCKKYNDMDFRCQ
jgi:hypothetical protein